MKLEIRDVTKTYGSKKALNSLNLTLKEGIYGILGSNGAGKSTLMNLISDNVKRDSGSILFNGKDILELKSGFRKILGYMPQQQGFYEQFTAKAFMLYIARLKGISRKDAEQQTKKLLEIVNLSDVAHKRLSGFSGGMRQRVLLAQALLGAPKVLILDEPTAGLDPKERIHIRNFISEISKEKIILLATHVVSDVECIADEIILMKNGEMIKIGKPKDLIANIEGKVSEIKCEKEEIHKLQEKYMTGNVVQRRDGLYLRITGDMISEKSQIVKDNIGLEEVYLYYLGE